MARPVNPPLAEHLEQRHFLRAKGLTEIYNNGPRRRFPCEQPFIEFDPINRGWYHGGRRMSSKFRPSHYWTRPCDGKRTGGWGRFKDAMTGEGPDVFITTSGDKRTLMRDRPQKWQWSGWPKDLANAYDGQFDPEHRMQDEILMKNASWTNTSSRMGAHYNFRTRQYESPRNFWQTGGAGPSNGVWRDAQWKPNAKRSDTNPYNYQTPDTQWWTRVPAGAGWFPGGRPRF